MKNTISDHGFRQAEGFILEIEEINIAAWCPDDEAKMPAEQVHLSFSLKDASFPIVARFKSPETLGVLIEQLIRYRREVWPEVD